jgi:uncharacterized membrane protein YccF (DUF307 family)
MNLLGNLIWLLFGGLVMALEYFVAGLLLMLTIIGIPFGLQAMKLGLFALMPFAFKVVPSPQSGGCLNTLFNVIWIVFFGIWIALSHLFWGILLSITIIGIPFGRKHFNMAGLALTPFGNQVI